MRSSLCRVYYCMFDAIEHIWGLQECPKNGLLSRYDLGLFVLNNPNSCCYVCGEFTIERHKRNTTPLI